MFIYTAKVTKGRLVAAVLGIFAVIALVIGIISGIGGSNSDETAKIVDEREKMVVDFKNIKTNDDRIAFLTSFGWEVSATPLEIEEVTIPEDFDETYSEYNELQKYQNCDLEKYRGKRVKRYTYEVKNYPTSEDGVCANLLIYKNRVIGGDICSSNREGFMHGFARPE